MGRLESVLRELTEWNAPFPNQSRITLVPRPGSKNSNKCEGFWRAIWVLLGEEGKILTIVSVSTTRSPRWCRHSVNVLCLSVTWRRRFGKGDRRLIRRTLLYYDKLVKSSWLTLWESNFKGRLRCRFGRREGVRGWWGWERGGGCESC